MNPFCEGTRIKLGLDVLAKGYNRAELSQAFYGLIAETRQGKLLLECASFEEVDEEYNPDDGNSDRQGTEELIFEAVTVRAFSRTAQTMAALQRVLNKVMADKGMTVGDAVIGKPKKTGLFASVTVQFPISDGQTLSIIFHSPDNNKMKIMPDDVIIAFRWLLNKRDITVAVSPEGEKDVSLDEVGKRVSQLVEKNSQRFQTQQKTLVEGKKALEDLKTTVTGKQDENNALMNALADKQGADKLLTGKIEGAKKQLEQTVNYNDQLQAQIDALAAQRAANAGKAKGEEQKTPEQVQAEQDQAAFETKKTSFESELTGRGFEPKEAAFTLDVGSSNLFVNLNKEAGAYQIGARYYANLSSDNPEQKVFKSATLVGLDKQIAEALKWIDGKLTAMKKAEPIVPDPIDPTPPVVDPAIEGEKATLRDDIARLNEALWRSTGSTPIEEKRREEWTSELETKKNRLAELEPSPVAAEVPVVDPALVVVDPLGADTNPDRAEENSALTILDDITSGKYGTSQEIDGKLDEAAGILEKLNMLELYDERLNAAADYLTIKLRDEAAGI
jgi:hypothetical protein